MLALHHARLVLDLIDVAAACNQPFQTTIEPLPSRTDENYPAALAEWVTSQAPRFDKLATELTGRAHAALERHDIGGWEFYIEEASSVRTAACELATLLRFA